MSAKNSLFSDKYYPSLYVICFSTYYEGFNKVKSLLIYKKGD